MFKVGDCVVYPLHGAGVIEAIEEREILGERHRYYIMRLPVGDMRVMIPTSAVQACGLRAVIPACQVDAVLEVLRAGATAMSGNWNHRYRENADKLKSGDVFEVAEVVRNLSWRERERGLSTGERRMLDTARQILISELALAAGLDEHEATRLVDRQLEGAGGEGAAQA
ncbi:MAG TPA: CarD family transcriptional regulator [Thermaerobacter sp.]